MTSLRGRVLACFKQIHRARMQVFAEDQEALHAGRLKINEEFHKHTNETDPEQIEKLLVVGTDAATYLRSMVIQVQRHDDEEVYKVNITKDTKLYTNIPYDENWVPDKQKEGKKSKCRPDP